MCRKAIKRTNTDSGIWVLWANAFKVTCNGESAK